MEEDFLSNSKIKVFQAIIVLLLFFQICAQKIKTCQNGIDLTNKTCFNNLIKLDNYTAGQFEKDKDGNMFLLYSNSIMKAKRLFYGLKNNGRNYFEENAHKEIQLSPIEYAEERAESRIIFISIDGNNKQYLLSTSSGDPELTLAELYELNENTITTFSKRTKDFLI